MRRTVHPPEHETDTRDFASVLDAALRVAALSPSSHNCQPWAVIWLESETARRALTRFGVLARADHEYVTIALDLDRVLGALPGHALEMELSCGAFLYALVTRARSLGCELASVDYHAQRLTFGDWAHGTQRLQAQCTLGLSTASARVGSLASADAVLWSRRVTQRGPYRPTPIANDVVRQLEEACATVRIDPALASSARLHVFQAASALDRASRVIQRYAALDYTHPSAWAETYRFIRFGGAARDGLPIKLLLGELPATHRRLAQLLLAPGCMPLLRRAGVPKLLAAQAAAQFRAGPALMVLTLNEDDAPLPPRLAAGCALMQTWLNATRHGLSIHPLSVLVQHDEARCALQEALGLQRRLFFFARLGEPCNPWMPAPKRPHRELLRTL